ncbi:MAG: cupin domain-containing protein [Desulfobacteraceae bacterium]|jgi:mannose-6-phosphate isomerase-like protein (cupin superfamily)
MKIPKNLKKLSDAVKNPHDNFIVGEINDSCLRLAVNEGEYPWHYHSNSDELFIVLEGELTIEFQDKPMVTLKPKDTFLVPRGLIHKTKANGRTVNLCFEKLDSDSIFI